MNEKLLKLPVWPAFIQARCPRCRRGSMFANEMYGFHGQHMNKTCPHCDLTFEVEPGYFYVSMLLSYAFNVAEMVTLAVAISVLTGSENPWLYTAVILTAAILLSPFNFRYSRVVLLYWMTPGIRYNPDLSGPEQTSENTDEKAAG
ncbi:DUF983 domain-containing protein [Mucilaginibacter celer]|uniref:DUF983 domain-containing protein n=1 Tax=Mucilaginibacter celer TaxID=2305508 RepID=A0A494VWD6_9SPHI|nr:DUF983 domain-containing protein [Mucilaginibacter celer]AYL99294.1 DUF983 domain-containing protein [Mucilaginibacter celer]